MSIVDLPLHFIARKRGRDALGPKDYSIWCKTDSRWLLWNWQWPGLSAVSFRKPAGDRLFAKVLAEWTAAEPALMVGRRHWCAVPLRSRHSARTWHSRQGSRQVRVSTDGLRLLGPRRPSASASTVWPTSRLGAASSWLRTGNSM